jgi:small conductance mechanosensitive channel
MFDQFQEALGKLQEKLLSWFDQLILSLPNLLIALLVIFIGWFVARYAYKLVHRLVRRAGGNRNVSDLLGSVMRVIVIGVGIFIGLSIIGLSNAVASLLAGAGIVGLAVGFALQEPLANMFSGVVLSVKEIYRRGDLIQTNDYLGIIERITLRTTVLRALDGPEIVIPNRDVLQKPVTNYTTHGKRRVEVGIGISYGDDLETAGQIALDAVKSAVDYMESEPLEVI